jgi:hypothetical protein
MKEKEANTSEFMREQLVKTLDKLNMQDSEIYSKMRDVVYTQQYKIFDKIKEATCKFICDDKFIQIHYEITYKFIFDINNEIERIKKCNNLFYQGEELFMTAYKKMCRMDKAFSDYDFKYIYTIVRINNPIQLEKIEKEQTLKITYKIDLY